MSGPYASAALAYRKAGWPGVLPLPAKKKTPPPKDYTGNKGVDPTDQQIQEWVNNGKGSGNVALRAPVGVAGIDVDAYGGKRGLDTLQTAIRQWGDLPATWRSSSRDEDPVSGIWWYRIPTGVKLHGAIIMAADGTAIGAASEKPDETKDIEIVQRHHRYGIVEPSVHPEGRIYRWTKPDGTPRAPGEQLPRPDELPQLPQAWVEGLRVDKPRQASQDARRAPSSTTTCPTVSRFLGEAVSACRGGSRHDAMLTHVGRLVRLEHQRHPGADTAIDVLRGAFVAAVAPDRDGGHHEAEDEFQRLVEGAQANVDATPNTEQDRVCRCGTKGGEVYHDRAASAAAKAEPPRPALLPAPSSEIYHGLAGRLAELITEYVESDQASILVQLLTAFGIAVGIRPYYQVGPTKHHPATYVGLIGPTARGRKGTGLDAIEALFSIADPGFTNRIMSGIGSGENLVHLVRDPDDERRDDRASDRRLLLRESELARLLVVVNREGSTLSHYLRDAYDGKILNNAVKGKPATATVHHIGLVGHCTPNEVRGTLTARQIQNGLANRVAWFLAKRARKMARPPLFEGPAIEEAALKLADVLHATFGFHRVERSPAADDVWEEWYNALPDDEVGIVAVLTNRAETLVNRWALIYALMDKSTVIEVQHLSAALALYDYEHACVEHIWGQTTGDPMADRILDELSYGDFMQGDLHSIFHGHLSASVVERIASDLESSGRIVRVRVPSEKGSAGGRPGLLWRRLK